MKLKSLLIILIVPLLANSQPSDTTRLTKPLPEWVIRGLIFEAKQGRACKTLVKSMTKELKLTDSLLNLSGQKVKLITDQRDQARGQYFTAMSLYDNHKIISRETSNRERKKGRKEGFGVGLIIALLMLIK